MQKVKTNEILKVKFALVLQLCTHVTWEYTCFLANQKSAIFSCTVLVKIQKKKEYQNSKIYPCVNISIRSIKKFSNCLFM